MQTITYAASVAYLDMMTGTGLLALPRATDDLSGVLLDDPNAPIHGAISWNSWTLHAADFDAVVRHLDGIGWELAEGDWPGSWMEVGRDAQGRDLIGLWARESIIGNPSLEELEDAHRELVALAGLVDGRA
ncbi:MAG: hypothetical protein QM804_01105 [Propionicimonas sp.]